MWKMVKNEHARGPEEVALEVLGMTYGYEKKNCWMASLLIYVAKKKLTWIHALIPIDLKNT
jgi:hypothetical protein